MRSDGRPLPVAVRAAFRARLDAGELSLLELVFLALEGCDASHPWARCVSCLGREQFIARIGRGGFYWLRH